MKLTRFAVLAVMALVGTVACEKDITSNDDSGEPFAIVANRSTLTLAQNGQFTITAYTIDANNSQPTHIHQKATSVTRSQSLTSPFAKTVTPKTANTTTTGRTKAARM